MSTETEQLEQDVPNIMAMSDAELSQFDVTKFLGQQPNPEEGEPNPGEENPQPEPEPEPEPEPTSEEDGPNPEEEGDKPEPEVDENGKPKTDPAKPEKVEPEAENVPDYKAFHDSVVGKAFKANGREITITNPEDVISLMQMGANYHEKMAALKPSRRILKMLEQHELVDEEKLGFLIDLHNKNPQAIAKLVQGSGIDLMDFDVEQGAGYQSQHQAPDENEITLEDTIQELKGSEGFREVFNHVTTKWDLDSQNTLASNPGLLRILDSQKSSGVFDQIVNEISRERMLGRLVGVSDIQAYSAIEAQIQAQQTAKAATIPAKATETKQVDEKAAAAKKAAAAPRQTTQSKKTLDNAEKLFSLSDEEFAKIDPSILR